MSTEARIRSRRRVVVRIGLVAILVASATACIFDQSEYKGGGRLDKGATAATASSSAAPTETTDPTDPPVPGQDAGGTDAASIFDTGAGGG